MAMELIPPGLRGGFALAALGYAAISYFVSGQVVGERLIEKSAWPAQCQQELTATIAEEQSMDAMSVPQLDCNTLSFFLPDGDQFCARHGNVIEKLTGLDGLRRQQLAVEGRRRRAAERAVALTTSRCACAASLTLEKNRLPFAIHAGSARVITPAPVKTLFNELQTALRSPLCARNNRSSGS